MNSSPGPQDPRKPRSARGASQRHVDSARQDSLYTAGELAFWGLIGWLLDHLLGTRWIVIAGAVFGASAGVYLGYLHMRDALNRSHAPQKTTSETTKSSDPGHRPGV